MNKMVFLDTNVIKSIGEHPKVEQLNKQGYDLFTSELVIKELVWQKSTKLNEIIKKKDEIVAELSGLIKDCSLEDQNKYIQNILNRTEDNYRRLLSNNIIKDYESAKLYNDLMERSKDKKPPFTGDSDKGFKDTLIWLNFMHFLENNKYDYAYFVTNDKDFLNSKVLLEDEIKNRIKIKINIVDKNDFKNISEKESNTRSISKPIKIVELKENFTMENDEINSIRESINGMFYFMDYDPDSEEEAYIRPCFEIYAKVNELDVEEIMDELESDKDSYMFFANFDFLDVLKEKGINGHSFHNVSIKDFDKFIDCWTKCKDDNSYKKAFIKYVTHIINSFFADPDILPF